MGIIIKFIWRNIKENKVRTFLILFSITLSVALFFASMAISDTLAQMYLNQIQAEYGSAELMITPNRDSPSDFFRIARAERYGEKLEYIVGAVERSGDYRYNNKESISVNLKGYDLSELEVMNPIRIEEELAMTDFSGRRLIIARDTAQNYDLSLGESIELNLNGNRYRFIITAIASPEGLFRPGRGDSFTAVVPRETLASLSGARGMVSRIYLKTTPEISSEEMQELLASEYNRYNVNQTMTRAEIKEFTSQITTPFLFMLVLVIFISIFIIYTAFKVITMERLPIIGTFRSIGATKKITSLLLLAESMMYGILGSLFGSGLGLIILYLMKEGMAANPYSDVPLETEIVFTSAQLLGAVFAGVALAVLSSLLPILRTAKISIKDIILDNLAQEKEEKRGKIILAILLLIISLTLPWIVPSEVAMVVNVICVFLFPLALVMLVPVITSCLIFLFEKPYALLFANNGVLAIRNLRKNKNIFNSIALLAIGILSILEIIIISHSIGVEVLNYYSSSKYDIRFWHSRGNRVIEKRLKSIPGIESSYGKYATYNLKLADRDEEIRSVLGIDAQRYFALNEPKVTGDSEAVISQFNDGRNIILNRVLKERFGVEKGELLTFETKRGEKSYRIIGFTDTLMNNGDMAYVPDRYLKQDMDLPYYSAFLIETNKDPEAVVAEIENRFSRERIWASSVAEMERMNLEANNQILVLLQGFALVTMLIGIFGVFNNFMVNFITRKKSLAMYRSIGMSKWQMVRMILLEASTAGLIGGLVGVFGTWVSVSMFLSRIFWSLNVPIAFHYTSGQFLSGLIAGVVVATLAVISPAFKAANLNLVEELKHE